MTRETNQTDKTTKRYPSYNDLYNELAQYGQEHILRFWDELNEEERTKLANQVANINWPTLHAAIQQYVLKRPQAESVEQAAPAPYWPQRPETSDQKEYYTEAVKEGHRLLETGRVGGFTVAGGQGTRLGFDAPKGTFPISPIKGKSLFQLFAERLKRTQEKYGITLPWYIMTSPINHHDMVAFFEKHDYFGLSCENISFFPQGTLPSIDFAGKLLLETKDSLALSPNGHGGCLAALRNSGALQDMQKRGIDYLSYWQVDNPLVQPFDPLFLGLHEQTGSDMSSRALMKRDPYEKLGNFCTVGDSIQIVEYSDLPSALAEQKDEQGQLRFRAGSPAIHLFRRDFVEQLTATEDSSLPFHRAEKKVAHIDQNGNAIEPETPNAVKLEMFVFDALPLAKNPLILEAYRNEHFAPVKNKTGEDSIDSSRNLMMARDARWLEKAGIQVPRKADGTLICRIELSPRTYADEEDVFQQRERLKSPEPQQEVYYE